MTATFSEAVSGVTGATFTLKPGTATSTAANVAAAVTYNATTRVATLDPSANLAPNTPYTATLTGGASAIRDAADNPLATVSWTFTTAAAPADTTAPTVTARTPSNNATGVQPHGEHHGHLQRARHRRQRHHVHAEERLDRRPPITAAVSYNAHHQPVDPQPELDPRVEHQVHRHPHRRSRRDQGRRGQPADHHQWSFTTGRF